MYYSVDQLHNLVALLDETINTAKKSLELDPKNEIIKEMIRDFEEKKKGYEMQLDEL